MEHRWDHRLSADDIDSYLHNFFTFDKHADSNGTITYRQLESVFTNKYDVFLTHDWGEDAPNYTNHLRVIGICERLQKKGIKCWLDHVRMESNVHETMIEGIDASNVVVAFITQRYIDKVGGNYEGDNCKLEFKYAARKKTSAKMLLDQAEIRPTH